MKSKKQYRLKPIVMFNLYMLIQIVVLNFFLLPIAFGLGFLMLFLYGFILLQILFLVVWDILWMIKNFKAIRFKAVIPLLMTVIAVLSFFYIPLGKIYQHLEFNDHLPALNTVIDQLKNEQFTISYNLFQLPDELSYLSSYGKAEIIVGGQKKAVLFQKYSGFDNFFGYLYLEEISDFDKLLLNCLVLGKTQYTNNWVSIYCT